MMKGVILTILGSGPRKVVARQDPEEAVVVHLESRLKNIYQEVEKQHPLEEQPIDYCRIFCIL